MAHRIERVNHLIRREISELLCREVKDPRLDSFVAVTDVFTSSDLKYARVFVSSMDDNQEREEILAALNSAAGFLRNELTKRVRMRRIPELSFKWDDSIQRGAHLLKIIDTVAPADSSGQGED